MNDNKSSLLTEKVLVLRRRKEQHYTYTKFSCISSCNYSVMLIYMHTFTWGDIQTK